MTIIPSSSTYDQKTMTKMLEHDKVAKGYRAFFALFHWEVVPEPPMDPSRPGKRPHPQSTYLKALLVKIVAGLGTCTRLRDYLLDHPLLVLELGCAPGAGCEPTLRL